MSIKTLRKRIALVAVSALGAGLMSVVAVPTANAAEKAAGDSGAILVSGPICSASSLIGGAPIAADGATADASPFENGGTNGKLLIVPIGSALNVEMDDSDKLQLSGSSLGVSRLFDSGDITKLATATLNNKGLTVVTAGGADQNVGLSAVAVGTTYLIVDTASTTAAKTTANSIKVDVVATCASSTFSATLSKIELKTSDAAAADSVDDAVKFDYDDTPFLSITANNGYGVALPSKTWTVTATNDALVGIADGAGATCGDISSASVAATGADVRIAICSPDDAVSTTVKVLWGTTLIAEKSLIITGDLAKIEVSSVIGAATNVQNYKAFKVKTFDAAGNQIVWADGSLTISAPGDGNVTAADAGVTIINDFSYATNYVTCSATAKGTSTLKIKGVTAANTVVYSPEFKVTCSKSTAATYTASLDKAVYAPGDIATLTISAKDSNGNVVADPYDTDNAGTVPDTFTYVAGNNTAVPAIAGGQLTAVAAAAAADYFVGGAKKYQFVVGATEGAYQLTVNLSAIATDVAKAVPYTIKSSTTSVTNAEVLSAIVKLIASINEQIALLQKQLAKATKKK